MSVFLFFLIALQQSNIRAIGFGNGSESRNKIIYTFESQFIKITQCNIGHRLTSELSDVERNVLSEHWTWILTLTNFPLTANHATTEQTRICWFFLEKKCSRQNSSIVPCVEHSCDMKSYIPYKDKNHLSKGKSHKNVHILHSTVQRWHKILADLTQSHPRSSPRHYLLPRILTASLGFVQKCESNKC